MDAMIKDIPLSGTVNVVDIVTEKTLYSGPADEMPTRIRFQIAERVNSLNGVTCIGVRYQKVYYDTEADWYYYESYFRSVYDESTHDGDLFNTFEEFMKYELTAEPIMEV